MNLLRIYIFFDTEFNTENVKLINIKKKLKKDSLVRCRLCLISVRMKGKSTENETLLSRFFNLAGLLFQAYIECAVDLKCLCCYSE